MHSFSIRTSKKYEFINISSKVKDLLNKEGIEEGICVIFTPHTTAAITINENADPDVQDDFYKYFNKMFPNNLNFEHSEGNTPSHILSSMMGASETIIIHNKNFMLGIWQGIYFLELDGPRQRDVFVKFIKE